MSETKALMRHHLAALAYRTRGALRGAPSDFGAFEAGEGVRTPHQLLNHMSNLVRFTLRAMRGEEGEPLDLLPDFDDEVRQHHVLLCELSAAFEEASFDGEGMAERILQGPLSDAMTHVGQLALLRRLAGAPIPAEDFFNANISRNNIPRFEGEAICHDTDHTDADVRG